MKKILSILLLLVASSAFAQRVVLPSTTFCVATTGSDANTGISPNCWATGTHAWSAVRDSYDLQGQFVTVNVAAGTYGGFLAEGPLVGGRGAQSFTFNCTAANQGCTISATGTAALNAKWGAEVRIKNFQMTGGVIINADEAKVEFYSLQFAGAAASHINASGRTTVTSMDSGSWISSGGLAFVTAENHAEINLAGQYLTFGAAGITFSNAFAVADEGSIINLQSMTWAGYTCTGARYNVTSNAIIETGHSTTWIPCSGAGASASGGIYE